MGSVIESVTSLMQRGGMVMWPLLGLSVLAVTLTFERCWFFVRMNRPGRLRKVQQLAQLLRQGEHGRARDLAADDTTAYGDVVRKLDRCCLLDREPLGGEEVGIEVLALTSVEEERADVALINPKLLDEPASDASAADAVESQRHRLERFMPTLSTIITAAPMLGILGTVLGIIASFELLSAQNASTDPQSVSQGIAESLLTTAAGLVVAVVTLFPYNALRAQVDRTLSRLESLAAAALHAAKRDE